MPFRTTFHNNVTTPLPPDISPESMVALLHNHSYIIHTQPIVTRFSPRAPDQTAEDGKDQGITYDVWETIHLLPCGAGPKEIHFTASFRDTVDGVVSIVRAPMGFVSEATYVVRRREAGEDIASGGKRVENQQQDVTGEWVLEEKIKSECSAVLKPFVQGTMVPVRRKMHQGMIVHLREHKTGDGGEVAEAHAQ